jgi:hypothetical protein
VWQVPISLQAEELKLLVRDAGSERLGSVTIPVQALLNAQESSPTRRNR